MRNTIRRRKCCIRTVLLRAESVKGQIGGSVPATTAEQQENPSLLMETSSIDLSVMGSMMGGGRGGIPGFRPAAGWDRRRRYAAEQHSRMTEPVRRATQIPPYPVQRAGEVAPAAPDNSRPGGFAVRRKCDPSAAAERRNSRPEPKRAGNAPKRRGNAAKQG